MVLAVAGILVGLALLTFAADQFVVGAARLAVTLRISPIVVGAVVVGFGTSAPELLTSGLAASDGRIDLAVGNIIGSNVANLTLVLGIAALVTPIVVRSTALRREAPMSLVAVLAFALLVQNGLGPTEGVVLAIILVASLTTIIALSRGDGGGDTLLADVEGFLGGVVPSPSREALRTVLGLGGTIAAAYLLVESATLIATELGLAQGFVGFTVVAVGTSLPELATAVQGARRGETDLIVGNLLGSNLFNAAAVGALAAFVGTAEIPDPSMTGLGVGLMVGIALAATLFMFTGRRVVRWEGALLLAAYLAVLPLLAR